jgi:hypothetical protein
MFSTLFIKEKIFGEYRNLFLNNKTNIFAINLYITLIYIEIYIFSYEYRILIIDILLKFELLTLCKFIYQKVRIF